MVRWKLRVVGDHWEATWPTITSHQQHPSTRGFCFLVVHTAGWLLTSWQEAEPERGNTISISHLFWVIELTHCSAQLLALRSRMRRGCAVSISGREMKMTSSRTVTSEDQLVFLRRWGETAHKNWKIWRLPRSEARASPLPSGGGSLPITASPILIRQLL